MERCIFCFQKLKEQHMSSIKPIIISTVLILTASMLTYIFVNRSKLTDTYQIGSIEGYDLSSPEVRLELPEILHEVSGLTDIDPQTIACIQDEDGLVFIYDLQKNEIKDQFKFDENGDYEGITRVDNTLYILRSDGKLFEIQDYDSTDIQVNEYDTEIPIKDNEGLGADLANNRLLIAGKSEPKGEEYKNSRAIFAFDLSTKKMIEKPVYKFNIEEIEAFLQNTNTGLKGKPKIRMNPSAVAIHPFTNQLYVLSSKDHLIYVFSAEGSIETVQQLNKKMFKQAEGIAFLENGDLIISNEGGKGKPTLLYFTYTK